MIHHFILNLTFKGPLLTKSSAPGAYGVDAPFHANPAGELIFPGSLLKGRLRDGLRILHGLAPDAIPNPETWLGPESQPSGRFNTRLHLSDGRVLTPPLDGRRTRVQIDPQRLAASENMLQVVAQPFPSGSTVDVAAELTFHAHNESSADVARIVTKAFLFTGAAGGYTTVGFGEITGVSVVPAAAPTPALPAVDADILALQLTTADLLCVTSHAHPADNLFEATATIPGSALKGAIASLWCRLLQRSEGMISAETDASRKELAANFHLVRFSHAVPSDNPGIIPVEIPLSLADSGADFALHASPPVTLTEAPKFQPDWKDPYPERIRPSFPRPNIKKELRVRTAIDPNSRRAADSQLFSQELIVPTGLYWQVTVDFGAIEDTTTRAAARQQLTALIAGGIPGVGKTKARMVISYPASAPAQEPPNNPAPKDGLYVLTLQTPALLSDPRSLIRARASHDLHRAYSDYFASVAGPSLTLSHFFARQELQGGKYLYTQFQKGRSPDQYEPYLVTLPGSVFVLRVAEESLATAKVQHWLRFGLPVPPWATERFARHGLPGDAWQNHPFHPSNGFGQIAVNLPIHFSGAPNA